MAVERAQDGAKLRISERERGRGEMYKYSIFEIKYPEVSGNYYGRFVSAALSHIARPAKGWYNAAGTNGERRQ